MAVVVDLTKRNEYVTFSGSSPEDISYSSNFWQSIQLHPPMESRLVSSDIKQRLKVAPPSSSGVTLRHHVAQSAQQDPLVFQDFLSRAKTIQHLEEYTRMQKFAEAKAQDKNILLKQREIRKKKEEISRNKGIKPRGKGEGDYFYAKEEYEMTVDEDMDSLEQLNAFETNHFGAGDSDSD